MAQCGLEPEALTVWLVWESLACESSCEISTRSKVHLAYPVRLVSLVIHRPGSVASGVLAQQSPDCSSINM